MAEKIAIVLFNLGGPDRLESVKPFLFNLFNDPSIIDLPRFVRWPLAKFIAARRAPVAQEIYRQLGGSSPLLRNTEEQATALESAFPTSRKFKCFVAMRYWHPRAVETAKRVMAFTPDRVVLLPLYPQFSGTTTGSSIKEWQQASRKAGLRAPTKTICCYAANSSFVATLADRITALIESTDFHGRKPRLLFTAHGLPQKIVDRGDPYQWQIEQTAKAVIARLALDDLDWQVCYQSRVGRLVWLQPYTEDALKQAGRDGVPAILIPVAFTSEHSETLVELDIEYRQLAAECGVPQYLRVDTVGSDRQFVDGLVSLVQRALDSPDPLVSDNGPRWCPKEQNACAFTAPYV